jgi:hypothetical protein
MPKAKRPYRSLGNNESNRLSKSLPRLSLRLGCLRTHIIDDWQGVLDCRIGWSWWPSRQFPSTRTPCVVSNAIHDNQSINIFLVPRLRLGTHCREARPRRTPRAAIAWRAGHWQVVGGSGEA